MRIRSLLTILSLLAASVLAGTISFDPQRGLVEVAVVIDGRVKGKFGIDTGADRLYMDRGFAERNNLKVDSGPPQRAITGVEGSSEAASIGLRSIEVGDETLYNLTATAIDLGALIGDKSKGYPDGLIGHDVLRRFYITVDYQQQSLAMHMEEPGFLKGSDYTSVPFTGNRHLILVDVTFNDSVTAPMILDYCASYTVITPELAVRLGVDSSAGARPIIDRMQLTDGTFTPGVHTSVSDLSNLRRSGLRAGFEGILGYSFLYRHRITVDYKRGKIYVHDK